MHTRWWWLAMASSRRSGLHLRVGGHLLCRPLMHESYVQMQQETRGHSLTPLYTAHGMLVGCPCTSEALYRGGRGSGGQA